MTKERKLVEAGRVRKAFGIKGELLVFWNNGLCPVKSKKIFLRTVNSTKTEEFTVASDKPHGDANIVRLKEVTSRNSSELLRGAEILVDQAELPELGENEFYIYELIDMKVETTDGEFLGKIVEIFPTGSNDVYVVRDGVKEILIPAIADVVKEVDKDAGVIKVELIEGLR